MNPLPPIRAFLVAGLLGLAAVFTPAHAGEAPVAVGLRVGVHPSFQRLVFDWPGKVAYAATQSGQTVTIRFEKPATVDLAPAQNSTLTYVKTISQKIDGGATLVTVALADGITLDTFDNGGHVVADMQAMPAQEKAKAAAAPAQAQKPAPDTSAAPVVAAVTPTAPAPTASAPPAPAAAPVVDTPTMPLATTSAEVTASASTATPPVMAAPAPAASMPATASPVAATPAAKKSRTPPDLKELGDDPLQLIALDPGLVLPLAVWRRADFVYLVFDHKLSSTADMLAKGVARVTLEPVTVGEGSAFRFYLPQEVGIHVLRENNVWVVYATKRNRSAPISLTVTPQPFYALGARIVMPISKSGDPLRFTDPDVGDNLIVVPLPDAGQAVRVPYHYADFEFYPAEQGVVIAPRHESLAVRRQQSQGIEITIPGGLHLSPDEDSGYVRPATGGSEATYLFNFNAWYGPRDLSYTVMRQRWERALAEISPDERDRVRLEMAQFQFVRGHYHEAASMLDLLVRRLPDLENRAEFLSLRGAVRVMIRDPQDAVKDLSHPELADKPEVKLWLGMAATAMQQWKQANDYFTQADPVLEHYPEPYFTRFSIAAAESALADNNRVYAANILDRLVHRHPEMENTSNAVAYLRGVFLGQAGHFERAEELWKQASQGDDPLYRVRAIISLTDLQVLKGKITPLEAAERLEHLRFAWRGDDLELDILRRLGKFYIEAGKVSDGLNTLKEVLAFLPDNEQAKALRTEMASAFRDVFLSDAGQKLSPLDALSLYERFYELAPEGEEGDNLIRTLAERMVAVDLLDRGADILADQARRRLVSTFKSRVGAESAAIYLLDHNPKAALKIIADTAQPNLPPDLVEQRALLGGRAYSDMGQRDEAEKAIADYHSDAAQRLMIDIAWKAHDWPRAAQLLADLTGAAPPEGKDLDDKQAQLVTDRAIALAMNKDSAGLDALRAAFGEAMKKTVDAKLFRSITEPETGLPKDEDAAHAVAEAGLFQDYLEDYRKLK